MTPEEILDIPPAKLAAMSDEELLNNYLNDLIPLTRAPFAAVKDETLITTPDGQRLTAAAVDKQQAKIKSTIDQALAALNVKFNQPLPPPKK